LEANRGSKGSIPPLEECTKKPQWWWLEQQWYRN
jgi:hypothetical protein